MNNNIVDKLFFELIQVSVENRTCITKVPSTDEWNELHQKAKKQAIVGMIFYAISKLPKNQMPESKILLSWYAESEFIKRRNMLMNQRTAEATKQFADSGMRSLILKDKLMLRIIPILNIVCQEILIYWLRENVKILLNMFCKGTMLSMYSFIMWTTLYLMM